jgi:hypothetical protein
MEHEVQHSKFKAINPNKHERVSKSITENQLNVLMNSSFDNLSSTIMDILEPELKKSLDLVKDEALAYTKNPDIN